MSFNRSNIKQQGRDDLRNRWNMKKHYTMINKDQGLECFSEKHKQETHLGICIITCKVLTPAEGILLELLVRIKPTHPEFKLRLTT